MVSVSRDVGALRRTAGGVRQEPPAGGFAHAAAGEAWVVPVDPHPPTTQGAPMTTVTSLAQSLSAHPGPWNGGYGWFPFFPFFGFFFFLLFLFLVFGIFGRRRMMWGGPPHRDPVQSAE